MGTHPIFESDFDCLTEMENDVKPDIVEQSEPSLPSVETLLPPLEPISSIPEPVIEEPPTTNITAVDVSNPYLMTTSGEMVQRKKGPETDDSVSKFMSNLDGPQNVATELWITGKDKAQKWAKLYGDIDTLRPYFDVE